MEIVGGNTMNLHIIKITLLSIFLLILNGCSFTDLKDNSQIKGVDLTANAEEVKTTDLHVRILEQTLEYIFENSSKKEIANLKYNDNQNYSMYVLPRFELITEEAHKDILFDKENKSIFMRIEILPEDINWMEIKESTNLQLQVISNEVIKTSLSSKFLEESAIHEVTNGADIITVYFINKKDINLKLTMFTKNDIDHRDAFFQMAKTILKETPKK